MAGQYKLKIIRVFDIAGHGKAEVDHVGELCKVAVPREKEN